MLAAPRICQNQRVITFGVATPDLLPLRTRCSSIPRRPGVSLQRRVSNKSIAGLASLQRQSNVQHASRKYKRGFLFHNLASVSLQPHTTFEKHEPMIDQFYLPVLHSRKESHACTISRSSPTLLHSDSEVGWI